MNGTLPNWIQRLLGVEAASGEGTAWSLEYVWPLAPWITFLLALFVVSYIVWLYLHESREVSLRWKLGLACVRLALLAVVLLMISQLTLALKRTGLPYVAVLVDDSKSMSVVDRYDEALAKDLDQRLEKSGLAKRLDRLNLAKSVLLLKNAALPRGIGDEHKLRLYTLSGTKISGGRDTDVEGGQGGEFDALVEGIRGLKPVAPYTRLGAGLDGVLKDLRGNVPAAIILLSDGINTEGPSLGEAAAAARRRGVPLFIVGTGDRRPVLDIKLTDLLVDEVVFVDDIVSFEIKLSTTGFEGREVEIQLTQEGKPEVLDRKKVKIEGQGKSQQVRLRYRPKEEGEFRFRVEALPLEGELQTDNNFQERKVRVRKEKIRVLMVAGYPNYEFRYMRNMLARDNTIELNTVLQDADVKSTEQDATSLQVFPVRLEEIFSYDVIIVGDVDPRRLGDSAMKNLVEFVGQPAKGGALVLIAGPRYMPMDFRDTPLAALLPVKYSGIRAPLEDQAITEGFMARPTDLGLANPAMQLGDTPNETMEIWEKLPELYWMLETPEVKMGTRVLAVNPRRAAADGQPLPLICLQYVGAGKVLFHATDETWRWRWRAGDTFFARYWVQMIRYLSRSKLFGGEGAVVLSTDRREYREGRPVRMRLRFSDPRRAPAEDDGVSVVVEQQGRQTRTLKLRRGGSQGIFEGVLPAAGAGRYHAWLSSPSVDERAPSVDFEVEAPVGEFENVRMDETAMRQAAEITKGRYYSVVETDRLLKDLPPGQPVPVATLPPWPLWNRWPVLVLLLSLLIVEWIGRKYKGMA
ncbi:MAG: hypothetical protein JXM70_27940 [Pirellulales bacterium]|nr:hypothetical protein [Pirellulales bacterium]